eukprot:SAG22_NODE_1677_length_3828_cov_2.539019_1_plen_153_part_00
MPSTAKAVELKVDAAFQATFKTHFETSDEGRNGPSISGVLLKASKGLPKSLLARFFVINGRRLYYFNTEAEATQMTAFMLTNPQDPFDAEDQVNSYHKGWIDLVGVQVEEFEEDFAGEHFYGISLTEELAHPDGPMEPMKLYASAISPRQLW